MTDNPSIDLQDVPVRQISSDLLATHIDSATDEQELVTLPVQAPPLADGAAVHCPDTRQLALYIEQVGRLYWSETHEMETNLRKTISKMPRHVCQAIEMARRGHKVTG